MDKRCGAPKAHQPHWHGKKWCDGKTGATQHSGS